ncbi:hypothetical protein N5I28_14590 [Pseudomonas mosselii]|uniref:DUF3131 domain-containing protein n=2 Tax=Pseudomonas mosselii TaxID=78327 RepID=A0ABX9B5V7_9PSED|nr:hypothetical protein [Pseudomonas mosselii]MDH1510982.1 hypothetical protein [Pseudomonas mosselii]QZP28142.1 hypothetical protein K5H97_07280 [Pseudomonas mosselii]
MRISYGWRLWGLIIAVASMAFAVAKFVDFDHEADAPASVWLQRVGAQDKVDFSSLLVPLPNAGAGKVGVKIFEENDWQVYRLYPSGQLEVFRREAGEYKRLNISNGWRRDTFPMLVMSVPGRLFLVGYDVVRNVPSGRSLSVTQPGFDVYEIQPGTQGEPRAIATGVDLGGGLDSIVYGRIRNSTITLCAERSCADIGSGGAVSAWSLDALAGHEFVEVAFDADSAYGLVRKTWDDRIDGKITEDHAEFFLAKLTSTGAVVEPLSGGGVPYALVVNKGSPSWENANSVEGLQALLRYELSRMRNGGLIDFGDNNQEGRIAWNQVYYLSGLISVAQGGLGFSSPELEDYARRRVSAEVDLIARLADIDLPGYRVKRYSLDREPLMFALHLGRVADLLARADSQKMGAPSVQRALAKIKSELLTFEHTVEHPVDCRLPGLSACKTLGYRQGYPFWADGVNVPFNYVSGYASGLLAVTDDESSVDFVRTLMQPLQELERFSESPRVWRYWGFEGQSGWGYSNGGSVNTPDWAGNSAGLDVAHITYRSMDAMALLRLAQKRQSAIEKGKVDHLKDLVSQGMLLPSVNEAFYQMGSPAVLEPMVSRRFSRSTQAWQIQAQVWALSDMALSFRHAAR